MSSIIPREFSRKGNIWAIIMFVFFLSWGIANIFIAGLIFAAGWLVLSAWFIIMFARSRNIPNIKISADEIMTFASGQTFPQILKWDTIQKIEEITGDEIRLKLSDENIVTIPLASLLNKDRDDLIRLITQGIEDKKQQVQETLDCAEEKIEGEDKATFKPRYMPHGTIQWKSTGVCMDMHCACGTDSHLDADCAYYVKCPGCERIYYCNPSIELVELDDDEKQTILDDGFFQEAKGISHS